MAFDRHELLRARNLWVCALLAPGVLVSGVVVSRLLDGPDLSERIAQASEAGAYAVVFLLALGAVGGIPAPEAL